ncbi:MAG: tetratricopeptide repeat protein [Parachlamydiaceae bacterium]
MKIKCISLFYLLTALCFCSSSLYALKPKTKYFKSKEEADCYLMKHYHLGCQSYNQGQWRSASSEFEKVIFYFPCSDEAAEASYYLAVSYFEMKEYDFANEEFSNYLKASQHPAFFIDAVTFKFCIAEHFKQGKRRRPFKMRYLPKWISAQDSALTIYDEVIAALPNHELAIRALYAKGELLHEMREYRESVDAYQTIIRRFPKNDIVPACYLNIADNYVKQAALEFQNPDILALAELNIRKFEEEFPRDERVTIAQQSVFRIKEMYARGLCDLGLFYERIKHPEAAAIYFQSSIEEFPDTSVAKFCRSRLICLGYSPRINEESPD